MKQTKIFPNKQKLRKFVTKHRKEGGLQIEMKGH